MLLDNETVERGVDMMLSGGDYFLCSIVILITILALITNTTVLVVTFAVRTIRTATYSVFFMNLCIVGILASTTTMVMCMMTLFGQPIGTDTDWVQVMGGIHECSMTVAVFTIAAISLEKFMYIKYPLHHDRCITRHKSLASLFVIWTLGVLVAGFPVFGFGTYSLRKSGFIITVIWTYPLLDYITAINKGCFLFLLPFIEIVIISIALYRVAKRAMVAVEPIPSPLRPKVSNTSTKRKNTASLFIVDITDHPDGKSGTVDSMEISHETTKTPRINLDSNDNGVQGKVFMPCEHFPVHDGTAPRTNNGRCDKINNAKRKVNWKALVFLTLPVCYFTIIWLPISLFQLIKAYDKTDSMNSDQYAIIEILASVLVLTSYALNPVVHGFMCKSFREEFAEALRTCSCNDKDAVMPFSMEDSAEDFMQFLVRTSGSSQGDQETGCDRGVTPLSALPGRPSQ